MVINAWVRGAVAATILATLGACSTRDPAVEQPIAMKPGRYKVQMGGGMMGINLTKHTDGPGADKIGFKCVTSPTEVGWIHKLMLGSLSTHPSCSTSDKKRVGNLISGTASCPIEPDKGSGRMKFEYTGVISEESIAVKGHLIMPDIGGLRGLNEEQRTQMKQASEMMKAVEILTEIKRDGECKAF
jgi:hypothetical protein